MPRKTKKAKIIEILYIKGISDLLDIESSDDSEAEEVKLDALADLESVNNFRFGDIQAVPKQLTSLCNVLPEYDEGRFRRVTRVSYAQFDLIYNLIKDNDVFQTSTKQMETSIQLALTLYRLGVTGAEIQDIASLFGVGDGSTITRITRRVILAILDVESRYIYWPSQDERTNVIVPAISKYLPICTGFIDGTKIPLAEAPGLDAESYFDKDSNYSLQLQLICDHQLKIRQYILGYPGSVHDSRVWNESFMCLHQNDFFSSDEWLCADKGYGLSKVLITPFRDNTTEVSVKDRNWFNKYFSSQRVVIEHVNGILKEIFQSLKQLKLKINDAKGHGHALDWVKACLILYNILNIRAIFFETVRAAKI